MRVPLGAIVALPGYQPLLAVVIQHLRLSAQNINHLARGLMAMIAYCASGLQASLHYLVHAIIEHPVLRHALTTLKLWHQGQLYVTEIYNHILYFLFNLQRYVFFFNNTIFSTL